MLSCWRLAFSSKRRKVVLCGSSFSAACVWWRVRSPSRFKIRSTICGLASTLMQRPTRSSRTSARTDSRSATESTNATSWHSTPSGAPTRPFAS
jgi:hypothetical protein